MKNKIFNTPKLKFLYSLFLIQLILFTISRLLFFIYFYHHEDKSAFFFIADAFSLGLRFDIRASLILLLPALLVLNLPIKNSTKINFNKNFYTSLWGFMFALFIVDFGYYSYLKSRLNATVIQFLKNPLISFEMVRETYPWPLFLFIVFTLTILVYFLLKKIVTPQLESWHSGTKNERRFSHLVFVLFFLLGIYGSFKRYPLRWSEAFFSPSSFSSNLALNPLLYVFDTYSFKNNDYEKDKAQKAYPVVADFLGIDKNGPFYDRENLEFLRQFSGDEKILQQKRNVIVIIMESLAFYKTGLGGSMVNPTPNLDQLAKESLLFTKFYTPTVATARSIFAAITSLPDITKVKTSSRNPFVVNQHTVIGELKNYHKYYFLGGSANWGNIRGVLSYNIPDLTIYEEGSYKSPKVDVWGISDLNLFKEASEVLSNRKKEKPFFALIQTSGFHRPYTIPDDNDGFKKFTLHDISEKEFRSYGFESLAEYNAMRLQDHSLGKFIEGAKKSSWYKDTIFIILGDHGLPHNNALNVKDWEKTLANGFHVPLLIHSPQYIPAGISNKISSEMDIMPTVAGLTGVPYRTRSFGKDLFNTKLDLNRAAFSYNWYAPFNITLINDDYYFEYIPYNDQGRLVKHSDPKPENDSKEKFPEKYKEMKELTKGLYESAKYLLLHNPHLY